MVKKILERYNSWKLGRKLIFAFVLVSIVPILFVQIVAFQVNKKQMMEKIDELMVNNLTQIAERTNLSLKVYTNLIYQIYKDDQVISGVQSLMSEEDKNKAMACNRIVERLKQYRDSEDGIRCLSVICKDGSAVIYDFEKDSSLRTLWRGYQDLREIPPCKEAADAPGTVVTDTMKMEQDGETGHFFHISKRLFDFDRLTQGSIGTVVMTIDADMLNQLCRNGETQEYSIDFIINDENQVIAYPDNDFTGISMNPKLKLEEFVQVSGYLRNKNIAINRYEDPVTGWIFCNAYDRDYMLKDISRIQRILVLVTVLVLAFASALIFYTVKTLTRSVRSVVSGMQEVQKGNLDVVVPVQSFDEIGTIADNFNDMTVKVKELIREVGEVKEQQKNAEIRALEAQINPHFLYNTLDSINWMAIEKEEYEISRMIRNLGVILRYSVNKSNQMVTIREVSDWLGKYISLQQMRFNNSFSYELTVDEQLSEVRIHKLLLQPFIENSILHGFKEMEGGGFLHVDISAAENGDGIVIIIEDNGKGMPQELLTGFNDRTLAVRDDGRSIGLHNAFARMQMYYGEGASWNITSVPEMGTVITIRLPREEMG